MRKGFYVLLAAPLLIFLLVLAVNLPDRGERSGIPDRFLAEPAVREGPENGFFLLWAFAEAPAADIRSAETRQSIQRIAGAAVADGEYRRGFNRWQAEHRVVYRRHWKNFTLYFPRLPDEDPCEYYFRRRGEIRSQESEYGVLLKRYGLLLEAEVLQDFTQPGRDFPSPNLILINNSCRLFLAGSILKALDGRWREAIEAIALNIELGRRIIGGSRVYLVHQLGRNMIELSLRSLCSLMNRGDFPRECHALLLRSLPALPTAEFSTLPVIAFEFRNFSQAVDRMKRENRIDPYMLKDYFGNSVGFYTVERLINSGQWQAGKVINPVLSLLLKKNQTLELYAAFWDRIRWMELHPPFRWRPGTDGVPSDPTGTPLWWLRNAFGKMLVRSAVPFPWVAVNNHVYRTHMLKARYDLTRILAEWHSRWRPGKDPEAVLDEVNAFRTPDPFSGESYRLNREKMVIYSVGIDRKDDGGEEQLNYFRGSDIAVPYLFSPPT